LDKKVKSHKIACFWVLLILYPQKLALFVEVLWVQDLSYSALQNIPQTPKNNKDNFIVQFYCSNAARNKFFSALFPLCRYSD